MKVKKTTLKIIILIFITSLLVYFLVSFSKESQDQMDEIEYADDNLGNEPIQSSKNVKKLPDGANYFVSKSGDLHFSYNKDWICKEVVYDIRVDCYPKERQSEEYDADFDDLIVPNSNVSIFSDSYIQKLEFDLAENSHSIRKKYGNYWAQVFIDDEAIISEEDLDSIIYDEKN